MDTASWTLGLRALLYSIGNEKSNRIWEANIRALESHNCDKPTIETPRDQKERFIRLKYEHRVMVQPVSQPHVTIPDIVANCSGPDDVSGLPLLQQLLANGEDINCRDSDLRTAFHHAVIKSHLCYIEFLCLNGCDINAQDIQTWTPLHYASDADNLAITEILLTKHAQCDIRDDEGKRALDVAAIKQSTSVLPILFKAVASAAQVPTSGKLLKIL